MRVNQDKFTVIAISGGSGSGKTTVSTMLKTRFGDDATLISQDSYYKDLSYLSLAERKSVNFDHPDSIDLQLLKNNIQSLKNGMSINGPEYCFKTHKRIGETVNLTSTPIIILEGLYSFYDKELSKLADYMVYVEASVDIRLIRRLRRDVLERGRDVESVISQYETTVRTMHMEFVEPQKITADIVVNNESDSDLNNIVEVLTDKVGKLSNIFCSESR